MTVTLAEFRQAEPKTTAAAEPTSSTVEERLGFGVQPLTEELAVRFGLPSGELGMLVVTEVQPYSSAARAGVRIGQRMIELEGVAGVDEVERIAASLRPGEAVSLRVLDPEVGETVINFRAPR